MVKDIKEQIDKEIKSFWKSIIYKCILYRTYSTIITIIIAFAYTNKLGVSAGIGFTELIIKTFSYYCYEKYWRWRLDKTYKRKVSEWNQKN